MLFIAMVCGKLLSALASQTSLPFLKDPLLLAFKGIVYSCVLRAQRVCALNGVGNVPWVFYPGHVLKTFQLSEIIVLYCNFHVWIVQNDGDCR